MGPARILTPLQFVFAASLNEEAEVSVSVRRFCSDLTILAPKNPPPSWNICKESWYAAGHLVT